MKIFVQNFSINIRMFFRMGVGIRYIVYPFYLKILKNCHYFIHFEVIIPKLHKITFIYLMSMFFLPYSSSFSTDLTK